MVRTDEEALTCDMAETYHVLDWRALPVELASTLAAGLREDSRIKMKMAGAEIDPHLMLMARVVDNTALLLCQNAKFMGIDMEAPESVALKLLHAAEPEKTAKKEYRGFESGEDFMKWRASMLTE